jgi:CRP-like cAMP-binding protein
MKSPQIDCNQCTSTEKSIFCKLEAEKLNEVSDHKIMNRFKRGQVLFHEGNPAYGAYCISSGKVKLTKIGITGSETLLQIAGPGDLVGFQHIVKSGLNDVTATALEDTQVCFLDRVYLQQVVKENSDCALELFDHVARDMSELQERMAAFQSKSVRERVAFLLLDLSRRFGVSEGKSRRLAIHLSRDEMAAILGVATETLIRELSTLKDEGLLEQDGKIMRLPDLASLEATFE